MNCRSSWLCWIRSMKARSCWLMWGKRKTRVTFSIIPGMPHTWAPPLPLPHAHVLFCDIWEREDVENELEEKKRRCRAYPVLYRSLNSFSSEDSLGDPNNYTWCFIFPSVSQWIFLGNDSGNAVQFRSRYKATDVLGGFAHFWNHVTQIILVFPLIFYFLSSSCN